MSKKMKLVIALAVVAVVITFIRDADAAPPKHMALFTLEQFVDATWVPLRGEMVPPGVCERLALNYRVQNSLEDVRARCYYYSLDQAS